MLSEISYPQFIEWMEYARLEPFDETRDDLRAASVAAAVYNVNRRKGSKWISPKDVVLRFGDDPGAGLPSGVQPQQSPQEQMMAMQMWKSFFDATQRAA